MSKMFQCKKAVKLIMFTTFIFIPLEIIRGFCIFIFSTPMIIFMSGEYMITGTINTTEKVAITMVEYGQKEMEHFFKNNVSNDMTIYRQ